MTTPPRRLVAAERRDEDVAEASLRPLRLGEFIGQEQARANLRVFIEAARTRAEALDHVLLVGRPASARPRSPRSWRASSASTSALPRAR